MARQQEIREHQPQLIETARLWRRMLYNKIMNCFIYENLPDGVDDRAFKLFLYRYGKVALYPISDSRWTVQPFEYSDILNEYYLPTKGIITNPYLPKNEQYRMFQIDIDIPVIFNSTTDKYNMRKFSSVADYIQKTAFQLAENDISYYCIQRNHRLVMLITAENDTQRAEANGILAKMYRGDTDIVMSQDLVSKITSNPITSSTNSRAVITEMIEFQQYLLANFYHSFGINSNYNLKREQLTASEIDVNKDVLTLNINDLLDTRRVCIDKVNDFYGLNIKVMLNPEIYITEEEAEEDLSQNETASESDKQDAEEETQNSNENVQNETKGD